MALFGSPVGERAEQTETSERTLYRKAARFEAEGSGRCKLPPVVRRIIVGLEAGYPRFSLGEDDAICYARTGMRPGKPTVQGVLAEEPSPLRMVRHFERYHGTADSRERRGAVVAVHAGGVGPGSSNRSPDKVSFDARVRG